MYTLETTISLKKLSSTKFNLWTEQHGFEAKKSYPNPPFAATMSYSRQSRKGFFNSITMGLFYYAGLGTKDLIQLNNWNVAVYIGFYLIQDILVPIAQHPAPCCCMNCILCKLSIKEESKHICILFGNHATDWMLPKCAESEAWRCARARISNAAKMTYIW